MPGAKGDMEPRENSASQWSGLKTRILSAVAMAALVITMLWQGGFLFTFFIVLAALIMMREWNGLVLNNNAAERLLGMVYVGPALRLAHLAAQHLTWKHAPSRIGWRSRSMSSSSLPRPISAPISPAGKSAGPGWPLPSARIKHGAGLIGGMVCAAIVGGIYIVFTPYHPATIVGSIVLGAVMAVDCTVAATCSESWMKRRAGRQG